MANLKILLRLGNSDHPVINAHSNITANPDSPDNRTVLTTLTDNIDITDNIVNIGNIDYISNPAPVAGVPYSGWSAVPEEADRYADLHHDQGHGQVRTRQRAGDQVRRSLLIKLHASKMLSTQF